MIVVIILVFSLKGLRAVFLFRVVVWVLQGLIGV